MNSRRFLLPAAIIAAVLLARAQTSRSYGPTHFWWNANQAEMFPWQEDYDDTDGQVEIYNKNGAVQTKDHPFFAALGSNGRACVTCHQPSNAMSVSVKAVRDRWDETSGRDPIFAAIDGSNCPDLPQADGASHSLLLDRGLFRIALPWPPKSPDGAALQPDFHIDVVRDPSTCNTSPLYGIASPRHEISVFRRPRVAANLGTLVTGPAGAVLMADGREPTLQSQATTAALVHEEATAAPSAELLRRILDFETQVYAAQNSDIRGGLLGEAGGPALLSPEKLSAAGPLPLATTSFVSWTLAPTDHPGVQREFRGSVARGSRLFATHCAGCHAARTTRWMDVGTANVASATEATPLPLFKVTCQTGRIIYTQDPGRALVTGRCEDVGRIVMPQFRGLAARAPYFSNGSAATLRDVVEYYDHRLKTAFTPQQKQDLTNFLKVL